MFKRRCEHGNRLCERKHLAERVAAHIARRVQRRLKDENNLKRMNNQARLDVIKRKREDFWFNPDYKQ